MSPRTANPFTFGALALDEAFTDRTRELRELRADILNGQDVVVLGSRRYGKSSLVLTATRSLSRRRVLVASCDLSTTPTKERLAEKLARTIYHDLASPTFRARERALEFVRTLRITPQITVDPYDASVSFGFDPGHAEEDVDATIESLLALPGELAAERRRTVALVLDEFQEITELDPAFPKLLRAVFQTQPEVAHVYLGSKRHMMDRIFNDANEPFWRSTKQMELGPIPRDEFAGYVEERFASTGRAIAEPAVGRILDLTGGHPYATQQLAYFVWEETGRRRATEAEVERGLERLLDSEHNHFSLVWEESTRTERLLLLALSGQEAHVFSGEFRREHRLPAPTSVQKAVGRLTRRELVERSGRGAYRMREPFLPQWLARTQV